MTRTTSVDENLALLREHDLAARWKRSVRTLQRWRTAEYGPSFIRIGSSVFYRLEDVIAFEDAKRQQREDHG